MATTKPKQKPRSKTDETTLRGRPVWIDETGEITGEKGARYSEVTTTIPFGTQYITAPTIDENGNKLSDEEVKQRLKDNEGKDFITGEKLPVFSSEEKASEYAKWRSSTMFDQDAIKEGFPEETFPDLPDDKIKQEEEKDSFLDYLLSPSKHGVFKKPKYNKGGALMLEEQMELFNEGGLKDEGGEVDPESGNDVPIGSTKKEVRDDIPAMLSEGEFVFPADVVRYIGLEKLMELRQAAKMGLKKMEAMGQMGNSEEATIPDDMPFNMADLIIVSGEPEEDKPKEMAEGGVVYANQGTFMPSTGIGGYQQSVFQNQPQVAAPFVPASSIAPPPPAPSPAGGYMPKFVTNQTTPFDDGSLAPKTTTTSTTTADTTTETDKFLPTVEDVYTQKKYINPETGETRMINFYNNNPVNEIPEGFIPFEDYTADETTTTDLESTSVETTQVRDDKSGTKQRLEDMVRQQSSNKLSDLKRNKDPEAIKAAYLDNEKTKAFMTSIGIMNPVAALAGRSAAGLYGKQLENLMEELGIEKPEIETGFFKNLKGAVSDMFAGAGEQPETYQPMFKPEDSPLSTVSGATNMLSMDEAKAYDNAVKSGNANVAEHYEIINNRLNKMSDFMAAGGTEGGAPTSGLSKYDIEQAEKQFEKGTGAKLGDSVNEAEAAKKARDDRKKYQKAQREKQKEQIRQENKKVFTKEQGKKAAMLGFDE